jgi:peptide/nickel transport system permease protein
VLQRLGLGVATLFVVSLLISLAIEALPGDFCRALGQAATVETVAACQRDVGLDRSPVVRYANWIIGVLHGDFGQSLAGPAASARRRRSSIHAPRLANTLFAGSLRSLRCRWRCSRLLAALYRNGIFDRLINLVTLTSIAAPEFSSPTSSCCSWPLRPIGRSSLSQRQRDTPFGGGCCASHFP